MDAIKIRVTYGALTVEFEGAPDFFRNEVPALVNSIIRVTPVGGSGGGPPGASADEVAANKANGGVGGIGSVSTIAGKLSCGSGPDLIRAAAARLTFVDRVVPFTRTRLLEEMKKATAYYKSTYSSNLSAYLRTLVRDGSLVEQASETYALEAKQEADLKARLGLS